MIKELKPTKGARHDLKCYAIKSMGARHDLKPTRSHDLRPGTLAIEPFFLHAVKTFSNGKFEGAYFTTVKNERVSDSQIFLKRIALIVHMSQWSTSLSYNLNRALNYH